MKKAPFLIHCLVLVLLVSGCNRSTITTPQPDAGRSNPNPQATHAVTSPAPSEDKLSLPVTPMAAATSVPTAFPTMSAASLPTAAPTIPAEARLKEQCLEVAPALPKELLTRGVVVMKKWTRVLGHLQGDTFLLNLATGESTQINQPDEGLTAYAVSPNRKQMAYNSIILDAEGKLAKRELVIVDANGQHLKVIPWEKDWTDLSGWLDNRRLALQLRSTDPEVRAVRKPSLFLALDPFNGEWQILGQDYPRYLYSSAITIPYWEGWYGIVYDPTFTLAIYPRLLENDNERYTYAIWDLQKQRLVASLEPIFNVYALAMFSPMPRWSPDGSKFVFEGGIMGTDPSSSAGPEFELYRVNRDGQAEQLTHLSGTAYIWETSYSWSPDGRYIAMFLGPPLGAAFEKARIAVLDTLTLEVTDFCLPVTFHEPRAPIWSPEGHQFLVQDWYDTDHSGVILVDVDRGIAAKLAADMDPQGWMFGVK
jgi:hypothetical protein